MWITEFNLCEFKKNPGSMQGARNASGVRMEVGVRVLEQSSALAVLGLNGPRNEYLLSYLLLSDWPANTVLLWLFPRWPTLSSQSGHNYYTKLKAQRIAWSVCISGLLHLLFSGHLFNLNQVCGSEEHGPPGPPVGQGEARGPLLRKQNQRNGHAFFLTCWNYLRRPRSL
jgi:hypothetical protein